MRPAAGIVALALVAACAKAEAPPPPAPVSPSPALAPRPRLDAAVVVADAAADDAPADAAVRVGPTVPAGSPLHESRTAFLDTPAWPAGAGQTLVVTWIVYPYGGPEDDYRDARTPVEMIATIDGVSRRAVLPPSVGSLVPRNQLACHTGSYPLRGDELVKVTLYEGGAHGFYLRRAGARALEVIAWDLTDGGCPLPGGEMGECPTFRTRVIGMHVPANVRVTQLVREVDTRGVVADLVCDPPDPPDPP